MKLVRNSILLSVCLSIFQNCSCKKPKKEIYPPKTDQQNASKHKEPHTSPTAVPSPLPETVDKQQHPAPTALHLPAEPWIQACSPAQQALLEQLCAVQQGVITLDSLLAQEKDVNCRDEKHNTLLHTTIANNQPAYATLLIQLGINLDDQNDIGNTALHLAAKQPHLTSLLTLLLKKGANPNRYNQAQDTPLHVAARHQQVGSVAILLQHQADPDVANCLGQTPLHLAAYNLDLSNSALLLQHHAVPNSVDHGKHIGYRATPRQYIEELLNNSTLEEEKRSIGEKIIQLLLTPVKKQ